MGFYLGVNEEPSSRLVFGYETKDGTKIEIFEERHSASWHLTVMRLGERVDSDLPVLVLYHAYSSSKMQSRCVKVVMFVIRVVRTSLTCLYHPSKTQGGTGDRLKEKGSSNASSGYWRGYH